MNTPNYLIYFIEIIISVILIYNLATIFYKKYKLDKTLNQNYLDFSFSYNVDANAIVLTIELENLSTIPLEKASFKFLDANGNEYKGTAFLHYFNSISSVNNYIASKEYNNDIGDIQLGANDTEFLFKLQINRHHELIQSGEVKMKPGTVLPFNVGDEESPTLQMLQNGTFILYGLQNGKKVKVEKKLPFNTEFFQKYYPVTLIAQHKGE